MLKKEKYPLIITKLMTTHLNDRLSLFAEVRLSAISRNSFLPQNDLESHVVNQTKVTSKK